MMPSFAIQILHERLEKKFNRNFVNDNIGYTQKLRSIEKP